MSAPATAVIFDYDGTLVDTAGAFLESVNTALGNAGLRNASRREISSMDLHSIIAERISEVRSPISTERVFDSIWEAFAEALSLSFPLRDEAVETLNALSRRGIGLALISKRGGRAASLPLRELHEARLDSLFGYVMVGVGLKEYGIVLSKALEALRARVQDAIVVSDWCKDVEYAKLSGMRAIGILGGVSDEDEHRNAGADWVVKSLNEIMTLPALD